MSGRETQAEIDASLKKLISQFLALFSAKTVKFQGPPIKIQVHPNATPVIQPPQRIPLHYVERLHSEITKMSKDGIIEALLQIEEPGTYISNLVITDKKWDPEKIQVTLDCQWVNKDVYQTHEPIPMGEELRHKLSGCDHFSMLDIRSCYHQFEIEEEARKLFAFRSPWGIFCYKRMVMRTSPVSSEIQKCIREMIKDCSNSLNIKSDILIYGKGKEHDSHLHLVLKVLSDKCITLQSEKCSFGKPYVKWFGNV